MSQNQNVDFNGNFGNSTQPLDNRQTAGQKQGEFGDYKTDHLNFDKSSQPFDDRKTADQNWNGRVGQPHPQGGDYQRGNVHFDTSAQSQPFDNRNENDRPLPQGEQRLQDRDHQKGYENHDSVQPFRHHNETDQRLQGGESQKGHSNLGQVSLSFFEAYETYLKFLNRIRKPTSDSLHKLRVVLRTSRPQSRTWPSPRLRVAKPLQALALLED